MSAVWKKTLNYLGLVEDDEEFVEELPDVEPAPLEIEATHLLHQWIKQE